MTQMLVSDGKNLHSKLARCSSSRLSSLLSGPIAIDYYNQMIDESVLFDES